MLELMREDEFEQMFAIMEESFPSDEYRPRDEQRELLADPRYCVNVHHGQNGSVDAFLAVWRLEAFAFLEHFAVSPMARNGGLGTRLLEALASLLGGCLCLEAELPDTTLAARRIAFYERAGFTYHEYPYVQPPISKGKQPVPLRLMTKNARGTANDPKALRSVLYREVYRVDEAFGEVNQQNQEDKNT